jgi:hypothetical protein
LPDLHLGVRIAASRGSQPRGRGIAMSMSQLASTALQRDQDAPKQTKRKPRSKTEAAETEQQGYAGVLIHAIPTEPLALYTFLIAAIVATIDAGEDTRIELRWWIFAVTIVFIAVWLTAGYRRNRETATVRNGPWAEVVAACVAFAAWGLVMPESPLMAELSKGDDRAVWTAVITAGGVALLGVLGVPLGQKVKPKKGTGGAG